MFVLPCGCLCSVSFPCGTNGWSVVCDCDISLSYSLVFVCFIFLRNVYSQGHNLCKLKSIALEEVSIMISKRGYIK